MARQELYGAPPTDPLLKVHEVARWLNVSRSTVYRLLDDGELSAIRVRHDVRIAAGDVRDLIQRRRAAAVA